MFFCSYCYMNAVQLKKLQFLLCDIIDKDKDSLCFYNLGNNYRFRINTIGNSKCYDISGILIV